MEKRRPPPIHARLSRTRPCADPAAMAAAQASATAAATGGGWREEEGVLGAGPSGDIFHTVLGSCGLGLYRPAKGAGPSGA